MNSLAFCEECETFPQFYRCEACQQSLCISCDLKIHDKAKRKLHSRLQIRLQNDKSPENFTLSALVFCLLIENLDSKKGLLAAIRRKIEEFQAETLFLLVWNENNEKINKLLLEIQLNLTKQRVIVCFMRSNLDLEGFFLRFSLSDLEKYRRIRILFPSKLSDEVKKTAIKASLNNCEFVNYLEEELMTPFVERTVVKNPQKLTDITETPLKSTKKTIEFPEYQPYKQLHPLYPSKVSVFIEDFFRSYSKKGYLMLDRSQYLPMLASELGIFLKCASEETKFLILAAEEQQLFHTTIRRFGCENEEFSYISLYLSVFSLESLFWVLKSLQVDEMTPSEKVVLSRIKESFCLKLSPESWKTIVEHLVKNPEKAPGIRVEKDPEDNYCLFLAWEKWICSDRGKLFTEMDQSSWDEFLDFLRSFFFSPASGKINFKSVENILEKQQGRKKSTYFNKKFLKSFIPGGKYGCCQFIKCCGTPNLRSFSFGRLLLLVQEAIDRGVLEYYKTLLVATDKLKLKRVPLSENKQDSKSTQIQYNTIPIDAKGCCERKKIKEVLLKVIGGVHQGVNLSRLPKLMHFYLNEPFDCQDFGFKKLKDFLGTFEEVELIEYGDNIVARLKDSHGKSPYTIYKSSGFK